MKGQWIGSYQGTNTGTITVNVDERPYFFEGYATLIDSQLGRPICHATIVTSDKSSHFSIQVPMFFIDPKTNLAISPDQFPSRYPGLIFPSSATAEGTGMRKR